MRLTTIYQLVLISSILMAALYIGQYIFVPLFFSIVLLCIIIGLAGLIQNKIPLPISTAVAYFLSACVLILFLAGLTWVCIIYAGHIVDQAPQYQEGLLNTMQRLALEWGWQSEPTWETIRREVLTRINIKQIILQTLQSLSSLLTSVTLVMMLLLFLLLERKKFEAKLLHATENEAAYLKVKNIIQGIYARVGQYVLMKSFVSIIVAFTSWLSMLWVGLELAAFWAICIFILNFIPYLGSLLSIVLPLSYAAFMLADTTLVLQLAFLLIMLQFVIGNLLDPYLMGNILNLSPLTILLSLLLWGALWGISGAFLAVPLTASIHILLTHYPPTRGIAVLLSESGKVDG